MFIMAGEWLVQVVIPQQISPVVCIPCLGLHGIWFTWRGIPRLIKIFWIVPGNRIRGLAGFNVVVGISWMALELIKKCQFSIRGTGRGEIFHL